MAKTYRCAGKVWMHPGEMGAWHFVHVDKGTSEKIRASLKGPRRGFGSVKVTARIGETAWMTSIFPDKRSGTYLLPLKLAVRGVEGIAADDLITFTLSPISP